MDDKKHRLVIDGNAFYELDLECQKKKEYMKSQNRKNSGDVYRNTYSGDKNLKNNKKS